MITQHSIISGEITEFVTEGTYDVDDVLNIVKNQYPTITKGILWNVSSGVFSDRSPAAMHRIAVAVREHAVHKKTAYFGPADIKFGLLRMYEIYAEMEHVPRLLTGGTRASVFRFSYCALEEWLFLPCMRL